MLRGMDYSPPHSGCHLLLEALDREQLVALMVDLEGGVIDLEVLVQLVFELAAGGVAVRGCVDEDVS